MVTKWMLVSITLLMLFGSAGLTQTAPDSSANKLTAEEKAAGWRLLFDGKTWTNWTLSKARVSSYWKIEEGWIQSIPRGTSDEGWQLSTLESFRNFELQFEWKIAKEGNSGVKYRLQRAWRGKPDDLVTGQVELLPATLEAWRKGTRLRTASLAPPATVMLMTREGAGFPSTASWPADAEPPPLIWYTMNSQLASANVVSLNVGAVMGHAWAQIKRGHRATHRKARDVARRITLGFAGSDPV